jgi:hypothetical protein
MLAAARYYLMALLMAWCVVAQADAFRLSAFALRCYPTLMR